jgi:gliding motility-associated-like protein
MQKFLHLKNRISNFEIPMSQFSFHISASYRFLFSLFCCISIPTDLNAQQFEEVQKITSFHRNFGAQYGHDIDVWRNYAVVGAFYDSSDANGQNGLHQAGAAYILEKKTDGNWKQVQKIVPSDRHIQQHFGWSVAIHDEYIVVGADRDTCNNQNQSPGAAYVFKRNINGMWQEVQKLRASDRICGNSQLFGSSVSVSGNLMVIGAYGNQTDENNTNYMSSSGAAYIFKLQPNGKWEQVQKITASDRKFQAGFGHNVTLNENQELFVSALRESTDSDNQNPMQLAGAVYVFEKDINGKFYQTAKLTASDRKANARLGSIGMRANSKILVTSAVFETTDSNNLNPIASSGAGYVFIKDDNGKWKEVQKLTALHRTNGGFFGISISVYNNLIAIGSSGDKTDENGANPKNYSGAVYVYKQGEGNRFQCIEKMVTKERPTYNRFGTDYGIGLGSSVALTDENLLVGAHNDFTDSLGNNSIYSAGAIYIFNYCKATYEELFITSCVSYSLNGQTYTQSGTYHQVIKNTAGCDSTLTLHLQIIEPPPDTTLYYHVCANEKVVVGTNEYKKPGTYTALFTSANGCDSNVFVQITHKDAINPDIEVEIPVLYAYPLAADSYQWLDCRKNSEPIVGANEQTFEPPDNGEYAVSISVGECTEVSPCIKYSRQSEIYLPTAFSPNGDGINDTYKPVYEGWLINKMSVFNRWGELIYESTNPNAAWDGTYQGQPAPQGVYAILIVFQAMESKGSVQLLEQRNVSVQLLR